MDVEDREFDDPKLKAAMRRAFPRESAPSHLRDSIQQALEHEAALEHKATLEGLHSAPNAPQVEPKPIWGRIVPAFITGVAAAIIVAVANLVFFSGNNDEPKNGPPPHVAVMDGFVSTHIRCSTRPESHHVLADVAMDEFGKMRQVMRMRLATPILAADLQSANWSFSGASYCRVDKKPTAHLLYVDGERRLSLFTKPGEVDAKVDSFATPKAAVALFKRDNATYVVVITPVNTESVEEAIRLRDELKVDGKVIASGRVRFVRLD